VLFGGEGEGVDVDTNGGDVGVVLEGLHFVEVAAFTDLEPVMSVELEEGGDARVLAGKAFNAGNGVSRLKDGAIPPVRVVEGLLSVPGVDDGVIARHEGVALDNPDKLLNGVVEVELDLVGGGSDGFSTSELENINEVLVGDLGELAAFIGIKVDVVNIERGSDESLGVDAVAYNVGVGVLGSIVPAEVAEVVELEVDAHLVVLEGDEGESKTRVAAEPELEGDVESVLGGAAKLIHRGVGFSSEAVVLARYTSLVDKVGELGYVTYHLGITGLFAGFLGKLVPDVQPRTIVLVNALSTDFKFNGLNEVVANPVEPAELGTRTISGKERHGGESGLEVHTVD
jgi:hypothetical protein